MGFSGRLAVVSQNLCVEQSSLGAEARFQVKSQGVIPQHVLIQWTGLQPGDNLLAFQLAEIKRSLELSPFVQEASVERLFPETLRIQVQERRPIAQIRLLRPEFREGAVSG